MEPLDDKELNELLRTWEAPAAPPALRERLFPQPSPPWKWMLTGTIRIPVPVGIAAVVVLVLWVLYFRPAPAQAPLTKPARTVSLVEFQPVQQLEPIVVAGGQQ